MKIIDLMRKKKGVLIGMVHTLPLPGSMNYGGNMDEIVEKAVADAKVLEETGFDALLVESTLDRPSGINRGPLQVSAMSIVCGAVHRSVSIPIGISFFTQDCLDVFSIAKASGADFVRINVFVDTVRFPAGVVQPCAVRAWEVRQNDGFRDIALLADVQVKHAEMVYPQTTLEQSAVFAQMQGADAVIVTGSSTGKETPIETIERVARVAKVPVVVGSGVSTQNIASQMQRARGFIVGSALKPGGDLYAPVSRELAQDLAAARDLEAVNGENL